jgi:hypothetical protein
LERGKVRMLHDNGVAQGGARPCVTGACEARVAGRQNAIWR